MNIVWDRGKNEKLMLERGICFEKIAEMLLGGDYLDIVENPTRVNQNYFIIKIKGYTWVVPFLINNEEVGLKTAFPNRKDHSLYRGENENK